MISPALLWFTGGEEKELLLWTEHSVLVVFGSELAEPEDE